MPVVIFCIVEGGWLFSVLGVGVVFSPLRSYVGDYSRATDATSSIYNLYSFLWCHE
jgi:hypothetical protein